MPDPGAPKTKMMFGFDIAASLLKDFLLLTLTMVERHEEQDAATALADRKSAAQGL